jgi:hypothetical protein
VGEAAARGLQGMSRASFFRPEVSDYSRTTEER